MTTVTNTTSRIPSYISALYIAGTTEPTNNDCTLLIYRNSRPKTMSEADWETKKKPAICLSVRKIVFSITPDNLAKSVREHFESEQERIFREAIEARSDGQRIGVQFNATDFDEVALAKRANEAGKKDYMKAADYEVWFDTKLANRLLPLLLTENQGDPEMAAVKAARYRLEISKYSGPAHSPQLNVLSQLVAKLTSCTDPDSDRVAEKLLLRTKRQLAVATEAQNAL